MAASRPWSFTLLDKTFIHPDVDEYIYKLWLLVRYTIEVKYDENHYYFIYHYPLPKSVHDSACIVQLYVKYLHKTGKWHKTEQLAVIDYKVIKANRYGEGYTGYERKTITRPLSSTSSFSSCGNVVTIRETA